LGGVRGGAAQNFSGVPTQTTVHCTQTMCTCYGCDTIVC
jgi:hypothetical protein